MRDKQFEIFAELQAELIRLDEAYVVGNPKLTLSNLRYDVNNMTERELDEGYFKVAKRIYEIQSQLNQDNCQ